MIENIPPWLAGTLVLTVKPEVMSTDWETDCLKHRRWDAYGFVVRHSSGHGLCYLVRHGDGTEAWYEERELKKYR